MTLPTIIGATTAADHARRLGSALQPLLNPDLPRLVIDLGKAPSPQQDWLASGGQDLTGYAVGPALGVTGHPASAVRAAMAWFAALTGASDPPGIGLIGERAALVGLSRNAPRSCGGAMRLLPCVEGYVALSLARPSDVELVPAVTEGLVSDDPWAAMSQWAASRSATEVAERCQLLGIPAAPVPGSAAHPSQARPWLEVTRGAARRPRTGPPVVVDLTSLWAGPLCARLLRQAGAQVIKVESVGRPDGARAGHPDFFERMNAGSEQVSLDFSSATGRARLHELVTSADVVLEASRPRALKHLGLEAAEVIEGGTTWLSITARGRDSNWVGFGDDVAAGAGLLAATEEPLPAGDALADPLAGVHAAVAVAAALRSDHAWLLDLSMHDTAALCATAPHGRQAVR